MITMMHYPPLLEGERETAFTALLEEFHVHTAVYGHLHGQGIQSGFTGEYHRIHYHLVSCDSIGFSPKAVYP